MWFLRKQRREFARSHKSSGSIKTASACRYGEGTDLIGSQSSVLVSLLVAAATALKTTATVLAVDFCSMSLRVSKLMLIDVKNSQSALLSLFPPNGERKSTCNLAQFGFILKNSDRNYCCIRSVHRSKKPIKGECREGFVFSSS